MPRYRKKPVVIEAVVWREPTGTPEEGDQIQHPIGATLVYRVQRGRMESSGWYVETLEGPFRASDGDWIIKGVKGEFYPCKPDIFAATYELVEAPNATD